MGRITISEELAIPDSPPVDFIRIFYNAGALKYVDSSGNVFTLSTGVTPEEVEDIVGNLLQSTSTVSVTYNDAGNAITLDVIPFAISHTQLSDIGTNTHAQIDSHIASTANPHSVTKAQIGLGNVDNTSDLNKPISTATQAALDLKYNASNPQGFETPAQLDARDTNNRARANHTGTQLASTISDFASSVRSTLLTGVNIALGGVISSADTILDALGKAQAQISTLISRNINTGTGLSGGGNLSVDRTISIANTAVSPGTYGAGFIPQFTVNAQGQLTAASNGPALVIGDNFENFLDSTPFSTNQNSNQIAASFTTSLKQSGNYRVGYCTNITTNSTTNSFTLGLYIDGSLIDDEFVVELKDATDRLPVNGFTYTNFPTNTTHTIEIRVRIEGGSTVTVNNVRFEIWRVS